RLARLSHRDDPRATRCDISPPRNWPRRREAARETPGRLTASQVTSLASHPERPEGPGPSTVRQPTMRHGANARRDEETTVHDEPKPLLRYSYHRGHTPHWIQALRSGDDTEHPAVPGRLVEVQDDGT